MSFMTSQCVKTDSLHDWLHTPSGQYLLRWAQARVDQAVADVFGFHALQLGLPELDTLHANRMPHRWLGCDRWPTEALRNRETFLTNYEALPFADASLDLLVLPHTLELSFDPHATLREVARVLVPEGRVVILGFNPNSLWGLQKNARHGPPEVGDYIGHWRLRDWLRLLSFEVQDAQFGCYRPAMKSERWLQRMTWMDALGSRSWPIFGGIYMVSAIKRVRGMRLMGPAWKMAPAHAGKAVTTATKGME
jgi:SAM-dependent methyltransferase